VNSGSTDLLKGLASGVRPFQPVSESPRTAAAQAGALDFASLLQKARSGAVSSGKPVTVGAGSGVTLSEQQIKRLEQAADVAEASGATKALVLMDGMAIKLDVGVRTVLGASAMNDASVLTGFDAVVRVPDQGAPVAMQAAALPNGLSNSSLLKVLSQDRDADM
jgi:hypothetical protein